MSAHKEAKLAMVLQMTKGLTFPLCSYFQNKLVPQLPFEVLCVCCELRGFYLFDVFQSVVIAVHLGVQMSPLAVVVSFTGASKSLAVTPRYQGRYDVFLAFWHDKIFQAHFVHFLSHT